MSDENSPTCPACNRPLRCNSYSDEWSCDDGRPFRVKDSIHTFTSHYLAANRLGPWETPRPVKREHVPGFFWNEREQCYERIKSQAQIDDEMRKPVRFGGAGSSIPSRRG